MVSRSSEPQEQESIGCANADDSTLLPKLTIYLLPADSVIVRRGNVAKCMHKFCLEPQVQSKDRYADVTGPRPQLTSRPSRSLSISSPKRASSPPPKKQVEGKGKAPLVVSPVHSSPDDRRTSEYSHGETSGVRKGSLWNRLRKKVPRSWSKWHWIPLSALSPT